MRAVWTAVKGLWVGNKEREVGISSVQVSVVHLNSSSNVVHMCLCIMSKEGCGMIRPVQVWEIQPLCGLNEFF